MTVVIPCYNYGRFLRQSVLSALSQQSVDVDVLIMDDASSDDTPAIAAQLARADARVTVVRHERNHGHISTFNEGLLSLATGDYLVLLSADDMLTRGSLARATAVMESDPEIGLVYGHPRVIVGDSIPRARLARRGVFSWEGGRWIEAQCRRGLNLIYSPEVCVRATVQRAVGGYDPALPQAGDLEMWLRIASVSRMARVNCDQAYRRVHERSMMHTTYRGLYRDLVGRAEAYASFFDQAAGTLPESHDLHAIARRRLAWEALQEICIQLRAGVDPESLSDHLRFAEEMSGSNQESAGWREYEALLETRNGASSGRSLFLAQSAIRRDLENRYRWCRWRLAGV